MPGGRPKGSPNKLTAQVKENIVHVFEQIGGVKKMAAWAEDNQTEFFRLYARLAPTDVQMSVSRDPDEMSTDELVAEILRRRTAETGRGAEAPREIH